MQDEEFNCHGIIFLGCPGSGKGTQCKILKEKYNFYHLSTGNLLREEILNKTELGKKVAGLMEEGLLVPDEIVNQIVVNKLHSIKGQNFVLDGYPRTQSQAKFLRDHHIQITSIIELVYDENEIIERLSGRLFDPVTELTYHKISNPPPADVLPRCIVRKDDKPEIIRERFQIYKEQLNGIKKEFEDLNIVKQIICKNPEIDWVSQQVAKILKL